MILRNIVLENFGLYGGRQQIDLTPAGAAGERPVILVGGKNGAGKTTLLEALRLALYGRRALGHRVGQSDYEAYLAGRLHSSKQEGRSTSATVGLEFDYAEGGVTHRYRITRSWAVRGTRIAEDLLLEIDGAVITSVPRDEWQSYLHDLIPPGVSQLFFFDGEKISEIANGDHDEGLAEAIRGLLGIEVIARLRVDLGLYLARQSRSEDESGVRRIEAVLRELTTLDTSIAESVEELAELTTQRDSHARLAEQVRRRFMAEGGDAATRRAQLDANRDELKRQILRLEMELKELANTLFPFAVAPKLLAKLEERLERAPAVNVEAKLEAGRALARAVEAKQKASKPTSKIWSKRHLDELRAIISAWASEDVEPDTGRLGEVGERATALAKIRQVRESIVPRAASIAQDLEHLSQKLSQIDADLVRANGHAAGLLLDELGLSEQQVGATDAKLKAKADEVKALEFQRTRLRREQERLLEEEAAASLTHDRSALAARTTQALAAYEKRLLESKIAQLQKEFVGCFNQLARKGDLIADIRINPETFAITLVDRAHRDVPKNTLSAGEKQIYAVAVLWALARTSGRVLPMIVDTPLARLDSDHRTAIIQRYFTSASHQVIVLSTDTEVDHTLLELLGQSVSHTYQLEYDAALGRTTVDRGYFSQPGEGDQGALQQA